MTQAQIIEAAKLWMIGKDTQFIADYLHIHQSIVCDWLPQIKDEAALMKVRAA